MYCKATYFRAHERIIFILFCKLQTFMPINSSPRPPPPSFCVDQQHLSGRAPVAALSATSSFNGRPVSVASASTASGGGGATGAAWQPRVRGGGGGAGGLRMAESETIDVTLKKPMGIVLEENVSGFGGLRIKEVAESGSAQVGVCMCGCVFCRGLCY